MATVRLLKIHPTDGIPTENALTDDIIFNSYSVSGGGQVLSSSGLLLGTTPISGVTNVTFNDPTANTINQTAGTLIINNIMAKERTNLMTTAGEVLFPIVTNSSSQLDNFQLPQVAGAPTATPSNSGEGFAVWDSTNDNFYIWNGVSWDNQNIVTQASEVANTYTAGEALTASHVVYISAADTVSRASASAAPNAYAMGVVDADAASGSPVVIISEGTVDGFTGLTSGSRYYLSASAAGAVQSTIPTGSGNIIILVGNAKNTTTMQLRLEDLGRRA